MLQSYLYWFPNRKMVFRSLCALVELCSYELKRLRFSKFWDICQFPEQPAKDKRSYGEQNGVRFFLKLHLNIIPNTISRHDFLIRFRFSEKIQKNVTKPPSFLKFTIANFKEMGDFVINLRPCNLKQFSLKKIFISLWRAMGVAEAIYRTRSCD